MDAEERALEALLGEVDAAAVRPGPGASDLTDRVVARVRRRRARRRIRASVGGGVLVIVASAAVWTSGPSVAPEPRRGAFMANGASSLVRPPATVAGDRSGSDPRSRIPPPGPIDETTARSELMALRREADARATLVHRWSRMEEDPARAPTPVRTAPDPLTRVQHELDTAGLMLVRQADRMAADARLQAVAVAWYRRTVEVFPDTVAARVARHRLAAIAAGS